MADGGAADIVADRVRCFVVCPPPAYNLAYMLASFLFLEDSFGNIDASSLLEPIWNASELFSLPAAET